MKSTQLSPWLLCFVLAGAGIAQAADTSQKNDPQCSPAHLKQLAREARTPEQYDILADCYKKLQKDYLEHAAVEKQEWVRRSQNTMATAAKYPRPVDSARNLYEYYLSMASKAEKLSAMYSQLAAQ